MSWQLASFLLVLAALAVAFWWYERSEPEPKLLAIVATLAALAALGRDAFAAIPDVKPITAIVLVSGLALGARAGFAIGAVSALASNVLLGEGPWTPWQMVGWGLVGVLGAGLGALLAGRRPPALLLALASALAAEVFNLVMDVSTWASSGDHSLEGFVVVIGAGLVFDLTHVGASFVFGLAFGPTLLRMLRRVKGRLHVSWRDSTDAPSDAPRTPPRSPGVGLGGLLGGGPPIALLLIVCIPVAALGFTACASASKPRGTSATTTTGAQAARVAIGREVAYLAKAQNSDGGFGSSPGLHSSELYSSWAAIGLAAANRDPLSLSNGGHTVLDAIEAEATSLSGAGDLERTILALRACGAPMSALPGGDPVERLLALQKHDGSFGGLSNLTAFGILALRSGGYGAHSKPVSTAARWLARQQNPDGGFGFGLRGQGSDVDDTAAATQALAASGVSRHSPGLQKVVRYLRAAQNPDGGFPEQGGGESNAQSTSWAVQGLTAAGIDAARVQRPHGSSPLSYLESLVLADGSVRYSRTGGQTPVWVTAQALTALAQKPFPIGPPASR